MDKAGIRSAAELARLMLEIDPAPSTERGCRHRAPSPAPQLAAARGSLRGFQAKLSRAGRPLRTDAPETVSTHTERPG